MVTSPIDANPLDPNTMYSSGETPTQTHKLNDLDMIIERNVAPSPKAMCAELAHQHAVEDLHTVTEHSSEQEPTENAISRRSSGQGAQFDELRKPED